MHPSLKGFRSPAEAFWMVDLAAYCCCRAKRTIFVPSRCLGAPYSHATCNVADVTQGASDRVLPAALVKDIASESVVLWLIQRLIQHLPPSLLWANPARPKAGACCSVNTDGSMPSLRLSQDGSSASASCVASPRRCATVSPQPWSWLSLPSAGGWTCNLQRYPVSSLPPGRGCGRPALRPWHERLRGAPEHRAWPLLLRRAALQLRHPGFCHGSAYCRVPVGRAVHRRDQRGVAAGDLPDRRPG